VISFPAGKNAVKAPWRRVLKWQNGTLLWAQILKKSLHHASFLRICPLGYVINVFDIFLRLELTFINLASFNFPIFRTDLGSNQKRVFTWIHCKSWSFHHLHANIDCSFSVCGRSNKWRDPKVWLRLYCVLCIIILRVWKCKFYSTFVSIDTL